MGICTGAELYSASREADTAANEHQSDDEKCDGRK